MTTAQQIYESSIRSLPTSEQLRVAALILEEVTRHDAASVARRPLAEFLRSLPPGPRALPTWDEYEQRLEAERNAWDR